MESLQAVSNYKTFEELAQNPERASSLAPRGTSPEFLLSVGAALRGLCAHTDTLKCF
jgi:hypothetical protein